MANSPPHGSRSELTFRRALPVLISIYALAALTPVAATTGLALKPGFADFSDPKLVLVKIQFIANRVGWVTVGLIVILSLQAALTFLWRKESTRADR